MEGTHAGEVCEELQPVGRTHIGEINGIVSQKRDTTLDQLKCVRSPPTEEKEGVRNV